MIDIIMNKFIFFQITLNGHIYSVSNFSTVHLSNTAGKGVQLGTSILLRFVIFLWLLRSSFSRKPNLISNLISNF